MKFTCQQCGKRLSRKTARLVEGRVLCSACMFTPQKMKGAAIADTHPQGRDYRRGS